MDCLTSPDSDGLSHYCPRCHNLCEICSRGEVTAKHLQLLFFSLNFHPSLPSPSTEPPSFFSSSFSSFFFFLTVYFVHTQFLSTEFATLKSIQCLTHTHMHTKILCFSKSVSAKLNIITVVSLIKDHEPQIQQSGL